MFFRLICDWTFHRVVRNAFRVSEVCPYVLVLTVEATWDTLLALFDCTINDITADALITPIPTVLNPITDISMSNASSAIRTVKNISGITVTFISQALRYPVTKIAPW